MYFVSCDQLKVINMYEKILDLLNAQFIKEIL